MKLYIKHCFAAVAAYCGIMAIAVGVALLIAGD